MFSTQHCHAANSFVFLIFFNQNTAAVQTETYLGKSAEVRIQSLLSSGSTFHFNWVDWWEIQAKCEV